MSKSGECYVGVLDFFAILLPGAIALVVPSFARYRVQGLKSTTQA